MKKNTLSAVSFWPQNAKKPACGSYPVHISFLIGGSGLRRNDRTGCNNWEIPAFAGIGVVTAHSVMLYSYSFFDPL